MYDNNLIPAPTDNAPGDNDDDEEGNECGRKGKSGGTG